MNNFRFKNNKNDYKLSIKAETEEKAIHILYEIKNKSEDDSEWSLVE